MSLDVYLLSDEPVDRDRSGIFIRENGQTREISREEWDTKYPGREPAICEPDPNDKRLYHGNITHNMAKMAKEAGIYEVLWTPQEIGITRAGKLVRPLLDGLTLLKDAPERFRVHNPTNGWGSYEVLVQFVADYLAACLKYPDAQVSADR